MTATVNDQSITITDESLTVSESVGIYECDFTFDASWDGWNKTAVFEGAGETIEMIVVDNKTQIPWEVLKEAGWIKIGVYGTKGGEVKPTIWSDQIYVAAGTVPGSVIVTPTPSIYAQILDLANDAKDIAEDAQDTADDVASDWASVSATATTLSAGSPATVTFADNTFAFGIPKGAKGDTGATGATGATPDFSIGTVSTLETGQSATATITGTAAAPVLNLGLPKGNKGDNGDVANIADAYSTSATYAVGDYCIYNSQLYRCTTAITTAEAWTAAHWTAVQLGDDTSDLRSALNDTNDALSQNGQNVKKQISVSPNLIDLSKCIWKEYIDATGNIASSTNQNIGHSNPIYVNKNVEYKFKVSNQYGANKTFYLRINSSGSYETGGSLGTAENNYVVFTPNFNGFITVNLYKSDNQMFCVASEYPETYTSNKNLNTFVHEVNTDLSTTKTIVLDKASTISAVNSGNGCYIAENGYLSTATSQARLFACRIIKDVKYKVHTNPSIVGIYYGLFTTYTIPVPGNTAYDSTRHFVETTDYEFTAPINGWVVFNTLNGYGSESVTPLTSKDDIARALKEDNPLIGKKLAADGDSCCWGNGYRGGYAKMIADNNVMGYENLAVGGATIVTGTQANGVNRHWICTSMANISDDADYIIIEGGVNDASITEIPLGALTSTYNATLDTTTFYGAMETIFKTLTTKYVGKKYGFLIIHGVLYRMMEGGDCYNAIYDCAAKWGVPICDLTKYVPPFNQFRHDDALDAVRAVYTTDGDGWHPSEICYAKCYVPVITEWLKTL